MTPRTFHNESYDLFRYVTWVTSQSSGVESSRVGLDAATGVHLLKFHAFRYRNLVYVERRKID